MPDIDSANSWRELWARVYKLDSIGHAWIFSGLETNSKNSYTGPWVQKDGKAYLRLYRETEAHYELAGYVYLNPNANILYVSPTGEESSALPFIWFKAESEVYFPESSAALLWEDYIARRDMIWTLWLEHVEHWKSQDIPVHNRYTQGITMHGKGELYLVGYNSHGDCIIEFTYPALSGPMPEVNYTAAYDLPIEES